MAEAHQDLGNKKKMDSEDLYYKGIKGGSRGPYLKT